MKVLGRRFPSLQHLSFGKAPKTRRYSELLSRPWQTLDISQTSRVFSQSGMHGRIRGKQKQWLKGVTGSALISTSWENAKEFSTIVRSLQEVISFPINYVPRRSNRPSPAWATFSAFICLCAEWSKHFRETVWRIQLPVMCLPSHFSDKEQWPPHK